MGISVVLLAYKEEENLKVLFPRIKEALEQVPEENEIIVIDTAQPLDGTETLCGEFGATYLPQQEDGYAGAFKTGIKAARMDKLLILDSDGSHPPETIPDIYKKFNQGCDIVIGSRYTQGGVTHDSASSIVMSKILNFVMRIILGVKARDVSTSFRMYDAKQLKSIILTRRNFDVLQEVIMRMKINNPKLQIGEVPIIFGKRLNGLSTRKLFVYIRSYIQSVFILLSIKVKGNS